LTSDRRRIAALLSFHSPLLQVSPNENGSRSQGNTVIPAVANAPSTNQQVGFNQFKYV